MNLVFLIRVCQYSCTGRLVHIRLLRLIGILDLIGTGKLQAKIRLVIISEKNLQFVKSSPHA